MSKRFIATLVCSALGLIGASGLALADSIGRFECSVVGTPSQEPIGDRNGHGLLSIQYSCFGVDGLLKGTEGSVRSQVETLARKLSVVI